ncbi:MAG: 2-oxo acid dehydrogenase subunit E2, partial [Pseudomonadota bacterium]
NLLKQFEGVHIGIATQTDRGLIVPVVRHCEALSIWSSAAEVSRVSAAARDGSADRSELSGSTITISSLGKFGGLATTPIINAPEMAIVGVNKMRTQPVWENGMFVPRKVLNLSCSFDHRFIDGWEAAQFIQIMKSQIENPAELFLEPDDE